MTSLAGALLGWISLRSIDASNGQLGGRRLAIWAIIIGLAMLPIQFFTLNRLQSLNDSMLRNGIQRAVADIFDVDGEDRARRLRQSFVASGSQRATVAEVDAFAQQLTDQFGSYQSVSIAQSIN